MLKYPNAVSIGLISNHIRSLINTLFRDYFNVNINLHCSPLPLDNVNFRRNLLTTIYFQIIVYSLYV